MKLECGPVYHENFQSVADVVINQGGTDSGKTFAILQVLITLATTTKAPPVDPIISILSESIPNLKKGAYRTFKSIASIADGFMQYVSDWNEGDRVITFKTGWVVEFIGATDVQNAKQGKRQYLFVNEANGIAWEVFWQFAKRTRVRVYIDYNPSAPFWAHEKLIGTTPDANDLNANVQLIISDHRHNPFLSEREHERTEKIKDKELHKVYARGKTGNLTGLIFPEWQMIPHEDFLAIDKRGYGVADFGYTNDPTFAGWVKQIGKRVYVQELCYQPFVSAKELKDLFRGCGLKSESPIYCDHDHEMLRQLRLLDVMAIAQRKGPDSVKAGITMIKKEYEVFYTDTSPNIHMEKQKYMWFKDPVTGKPTNEPIDQFNHAMDAIRAGLYTRHKLAA